MIYNDNNVKSLDVESFQHVYVKMTDDCEIRGDACLIQSYYMHPSNTLRNFI